MTATVEARSLAWDGCLNVRDLGGHRTEDGGLTRFRRIVRADSVHRLSDAGWQALAAYGVRTLVDLRLDDERRTDPRRELPIEIRHIPVLDGADEAFWVGVRSLSDAAEDVAAAARAVYLTFLERFHARFAEAVAALGRPRGGAVLVHCVEGKDRTGLVSALTLRLAGVGLSDIGADYALSERLLAPRLTHWVDEAGDDAERARRRRVSRTPAAGVVGVLRELERRYGSVRAYLHAGGASAAELDRTRARLLE